jgi:hypothetical protein
MRYLLIMLLMLSWSVPSAKAQVSVGIGAPGVSIGINLPVYPELVPVPGYPVYYAPRLESNYFFYDGMYWVYQDDNWYASSWYNGPWGLVAPDVVPLYVLRVPVRYYRRPPAYFRGWRSTAPPRWGEHWGNEWERHRRGWDRWNRRSVPARAPLPVYQRRYSGDRYPAVEQQPALHHQHYRYRPRDPVVRQQYQERGVQGPPASVQQNAPPARRSRPRPKRGEDVQRSAPPKAPPREGNPAIRHQRQRAHPQPGAAQDERQAPRSSHPGPPQGGGASHEPGRGPGHQQGHEGASQEPGGGQGHQQGHEKGSDQGPEHK